MIPDTNQKTGRQPYSTAQTVEQDSVVTDPQIY